MTADPHALADWYRDALEAIAAIADQVDEVHTSPAFHAVVHITRVALDNPGRAHDAIDRDMMQAILDARAQINAAALDSIRDQIREVSGE